MAETRLSPGAGLAGRVEGALDSSLSGDGERGGIPEDLKSGPGLRALASELRVVSMEAERWRWCPNIAVDG